MTRKQILLYFRCSPCGIAFAIFAGTATSVDCVTVGYASFSGHYTPMWISVEDRLGRK